MAYPTVSAPYGLKPVNRVDGLPYAGAIRQIPVAASFATAIFNGDTVQVDSTGYLVASSTTNSGNMVGVCLGGQDVNGALAIRAPGLGVDFDLRHMGHLCRRMSDQTRPIARVAAIRG